MLLLLAPGIHATGSRQLRFDRFESPCCTVAFEKREGEHWQCAAATAPPKQALGQGLFGEGEISQGSSAVTCCFACCIHWEGEKG